MSTCKRIILISLCILASITSVSADRILLVYNRSSNTAWVSLLRDLGHEVTLISNGTMPANVSINDYDQFWFANYLPGGQPDAAAQQYILRFIEAGGKVALFADHDGGKAWTEVVTTNNNIGKIVDSVVPADQVGNFKIDGATITNSTSIPVAVDSLETVKANPEAAQAFSSRTFNAGWPTYILGQNTGGGYACLKIRDQPNKKIGVAFNSGNMNEKYSAGRLFIFTDLCNALEGYIAGNGQILEIIAELSTGPSSFSVSPLQVNEDAGTVTFTVRLDVKIDHDVEMTVETVNGTAFAGTHYTAVPTTTLLFPRDTREKTFTLSIIDDTVTSIPDKTFQLNFKQTANSGSILTFRDGTSQTETVTILDNDPPSASLQLDTTITPTFTGLQTAPDTITFGTVNLPVYLTTDADSIYYTVNGMPLSPYSTPLLAQSFSGDTLRISATASGVGFETTTKSWTLVRKLPPTAIVANPISGTSFNIDTTVFLQVMSGGVPLSTATLYYKVVTDGTTPVVDSTLASGSILYNPSTGITINSDATIYVAAYDISVPQMQGVFSYTLNLMPSPITVETREGSIGAPGATASATNPLVYFGETLELTPLTAADTLYYAINGGAEQLLTTGTIQLSTAYPDSIPITFRAQGVGYETTIITYSFVRDTVATLTATPGSTKFTNSLSVTLNLSGNWINQEIYYTLDGSTPTKASHRYSGPITLTTSTTINAVAYALFGVPSEILSESYTYAISSTNSWYRDGDGDGAIDNITIALSQAAVNLPDSLRLINPFDIGDTRTILPSQMVFNGTRDTISVTLDVPFPFGGRNGVTYFISDSLGTLYGPEFLEGAFLVQDAVAPVIRYGTYVPGNLTSGHITNREADTLTVYFSEDVWFKTPTELVAFENYVGITYGASMRILSLEPHMVTFAVDSLDGVAYPSSQDSLSFHIESQATDPNNNTQGIYEHRRAPLEVTPIPMQIKAISGGNPLTTPIPASLITPKYSSPNGFVIVVDYMTLLTTTDEIDASVVIMDPVGNVIVKSFGLGDNNPQLVSDLIETDNRTRLVFYWSGENQNRRLVSSGAYSVTVRATDAGGKPVTKTLTIGVRNPRRNY